MNDESSPAQVGVADIGTEGHELRNSVEFGGGVIAFILAAMLVGSWARSRNDA